MADGDFDIANFLNNTLAPAVGKFLSAEADKFIFGEEEASKLALQQERVRFNRLNGSGPVNGGLSLSAPLDLRNFLFRDVLDSNGNATTAFNWLPVMFIGLGVLAVWFLFRK